MICDMLTRSGMARNQHLLTSHGNGIKSASNYTSLHTNKQASKQTNKHKFNPRSHQLQERSTFCTMASLKVIPLCHLGSTQAYKHVGPAADAGRMPPSKSEDTANYTQIVSLIKRADFILFLRFKLGTSK